MTANKFLKLNSHNTNEHNLVEFAKIKVKEALEAATKIDFDNVGFEDEANDYEEARSMAIVNAYPLNLIV